MKRRDFVKISGTAVLAGALTKLTYGLGNNNTSMKYPDEVWVQSMNEWFRLTASNGNLYTHENFAVEIKRSSDADAIYVSSPTKELSAVRIIWKYDKPSNSKFLGDHWERSYGDLQWKTNYADVKNPWYIIITDGKSAECFGVKTGANAICWWVLGDHSLELMLDTNSGGRGVLLGNRKLHAADVITMKDANAKSVFQTDHLFCKKMCAKPRLPKQPVYGINDWYFAYGENSFNLIKKTTAMMAKLVTDHSNKPFSVIDAGWAQYSPLLPGDGGWNEDFGKPNDKFKDMHLMADEIKKLGMRPGLWMRPLCARHDEKKTLLAPSIPGRDSPKNPVLDPTIPENIERIKNYFSIYKSWGYEMVKHDFTTYDITGRWGFSMNEGFTSAGWNFNDRSKTNAEIIGDLYKSIRNAAGDNIYIIGCNTLSHLSAGLFELCRIGDDTSGREWSRVTKMGVNTLAFRLPQHNAFYAADGDCVGITKDIPWSKNKQWLQLLAESGAPLFISAQPEAIGAEQKDAIRKAFAQAAKTQPLGEPVDWMTNNEPAVWKLNNRTVQFDWS